MREFTGQRFEVLVIASQPVEHRGETSRQVADLIAGTGSRDAAQDTTIRTDRRFGGIFQPADTIGEYRRQGEQAKRGDADRDQSQIHQAPQRVVG